MRRKKKTTITLFDSTRVEKNGTRVDERMTVVMIKMKAREKIAQRGGPFEVIDACGVIRTTVERMKSLRIFCKVKKE